jgi:hypothetical protein
MKKSLVLLKVITMVSERQRGVKAEAFALLKTHCGLSTS